MAESHIIETYGLAPHNRNIWPHNSRATVFCHAWPILLSVLHPVVIPLLVCMGLDLPGLAISKKPLIKTLVPWKLLLLQSDSVKHLHCIADSPTPPHH